MPDSVSDQLSETVGAPEVRERRQTTLRLGERPAIGRAGASFEGRREPSKVPGHRQCIEFVKTTGDHPSFKRLPDDCPVVEGGDVFLWHKVRRDLEGARVRLGTDQNGRANNPLVPVWALSASVRWLRDTYRVQLLVPVPDWLDNQKECPRVAMAVQSEFEGLLPSRDMIVLLAPRTASMRALGVWRRASKFATTNGPRPTMSAARTPAPAIAGLTQPQRFLRF